MLEGPLRTGPTQQEFEAQPPQEQGVPSPGNPIVVGADGVIAVSPLQPPGGHGCGAGVLPGARGSASFPGSSLHEFAVFSPD